MAKLPSFKRIYTDDYPNEYRSLIELLSDAINSGFENLYETFNNKVSVRDNLNTVIKDVDIEVDASGKPKAKSSFKLTGQGRLEGVIVLRVDNITNSTTYPTAGVTVSFTETSTDVIINHVTGLPVNNTFRIRLMALR